MVVPRKGGGKKQHACEGQEGEEENKVWGKGFCLWFLVSNILAADTGRQPLASQYPTLASQDKVFLHLR